MNNHHTIVALPSTHQSSLEDVLYSFSDDKRLVSISTDRHRSMNNDIHNVRQETSTYVINLSKFISHLVSDQDDKEETLENSYSSSEIAKTGKKEGKENSSNLLDSP